MKKKLQILTFILLPMLSFCQIDTTQIKDEIEEIFILESPKGKFYKVSPGLSYRVDRKHFGSKNIRMNTSGAIILLELLNDSGKVLCSQEATVYIDSSSGWFLGDSVHERNIRPSDFRTDSTVSRNWIFQKLGLSRNGKYIEYYLSGAIKVRGIYRHCYKVGVWKYYDPKGKKLRKVKYKYGEGDYENIWELGDDVSR